MTAGSARILVVDDNDDNRFTLTERLAREGYRNVVAVGDGRTALEHLASRPCDLLLLDIMMPGMNGYEVLEALHADERLRAIPVIVISAVDEMESAIRCIELGAEDYLPKPFKPTLLRARVGAVLEKKRLRDELVGHVDRLDRELRLAREIQMSMVPTAFPVSTADSPVSVHAMLRPAREVGGDLYDVFWLAPGRLCLVVADVSDKGMPAALFMARTRTAIRLVAARATDTEGGPTVIGLVGQLNDELCRDNPHAMFVALVICVVEVATGRVEWCNAGHPAPLLVHAGGRSERLSDQFGCPLGLPVPFEYVTGVSTLAPGASLFLYTDGITESVNGDGDLFGEARLAAVLAEAAGRSPRDMVDAVLASVGLFAGGAASADDIALVACRRDV